MLWSFFFSMYPVFSGLIAESHLQHLGVLFLVFLSKHILTAAAAAAKSLQSCPTLCDPIDGSPLDLFSSLPGGHVLLQPHHSGKSAWFSYYYGTEFHFINWF